jgi:hypothetical protein
MTQPPPDSSQPPFDPQFPPAQPPQIPTGPYAAPPPQIPTGPYAAPPPQIPTGPYAAPPRGPYTGVGQPSSKTNTGKIIAIVVAVVVGLTALSFIIFAGLCFGLISLGG